MTPFSEYVEVVNVLAPSLAVSAAVGISASLVGVFVLLRREALVALAMPQVVAVGVAIALRTGWPTLPPALAAVLLAVAILVWSKRSGANNWLLPSIYIAGLSLSFLIIANTGEHVSEMQSMFTGIEVAVSPEQAYWSVPALLAAGLVTALLWRRWLLLSQAPATAEVSGVHPQFWEVGFLCLLAAVLLVGTNDLGVVMVIAMLFLPPAAVLPWVRRVPMALVLSAALSILLLAAGLVLSVEWNLPLSQSVGGVGFAALLLLHLAKIALARFF